MKAVKYVWRYPDNSWIKIDTSNGPMSTGGYPYAVTDFDCATLFSNMQAAVEYCKVMNKLDEWTLYSVKMEADTLSRDEANSLVLGIGYEKSFDLEQP